MLEVSNEPIDNCGLTASASITTDYRLSGNDTLNTLQKNPSNRGQCQDEQEMTVQWLPKNRERPLC